MSLTGGVVGFDLGTINCVISQAKRGGIDTVLNEGSKRNTAFLVSFQGKERFIGEPAVPLAKSNYKNTITNVKRILGRAWSDPEAQREISLMPNKEAFIPLDGDTIGIKVKYNDVDTVFTCEQITAMMLNKLRKTVTAAGSHELPADIVVSVPGWWNERQRKALIDSCEIAGFSPLRILSDHTATALSYGIYKSARNEFDAERKQYVMFIDIGYSNTSVAVVSFIQGKLQVVSSAFDPNLGGRDFDYAVFDKFAADFKAKYNLDIKSDSKASLKLYDACEKAKQTLTPEGVNMAKVNVEFLMNEIDFKSELTLDDFEVMSKPLLERLKSPIAEAMAASGLKYEDIGSVEIIGGGTRPKIVKKALATYMQLDLSKFNYGLSTTLNLDEAVARGCALNSAMLSPQFKVKEFNVFDSVHLPVKLTWQQNNNDIANDVAPAGLDETDKDVVETLGAQDKNSVIILRQNEPTPATKRVTFRRKNDFEIVAQYEEASVPLLPKNFDRNLSKFKVITPDLSNIEADKLPMIRVDFKHDRNGLFDLYAAELLKEVEEKATNKVTSENGQAGEDKADKNDNSTQKPEVDAEQKDKKEEDKKAKKKKYTRSKLNVERLYTYGMNKDKIKQFCLQEKEYSKVDKAIEETAAAKNALESYIYSYRDKIDASLRDYISDSERNTFKEELTKQESWLYDEGYDETKLEYKGRLDSLKLHGDRYELRFIQESERPAKVAELNKLMNETMYIINSKEEQHDHITEEERKRVRIVVEEVSEWLKLQLIGQEKLGKRDDPVLTSAMVEEKIIKIRNVAHPVVTKRRPPPPQKKEESREESTKNPAADNMEEDADGNSKSKSNKGEDESEKTEEKGNSETMDVD